MQVKAVLFDLDGTLVDTIDDLGAACEYALSRQNLSGYNTAQYKQMVGNGIRNLVESVLAGRDGDLERLYADFMEYYNQHSLDKTKPYDGLPEVVSRLRQRGIKTAVITNKADAPAKHIMTCLYGDCFDFVLGQRDDIPRKPDPAPARFVMEKLKVKPSECVLVGDSKVDMQTAVNTDILPIGVLWGFRDKAELKENGAQILVSTPVELLNEILSLCNH